MLRCTTGTSEAGCSESLQFFDACINGTNTTFLPENTTDGGNASECCYLLANEVVACVGVEPTNAFFDTTKSQADASGCPSEWRSCHCERAVYGCV